MVPGSWIFAARPSAVTARESGKHVPRCSGKHSRARQPQVVPLSPSSRRICFSTSKSLLRENSSTEFEPAPRSTTLRPQEETYSLRRCLWTHPPAGSAAPDIGSQSCLLLAAAENWGRGQTPHPRACCHEPRQKPAPAHSSEPIPATRCERSPEKAPVVPQTSPDLAAQRGPASARPDSSTQTRPAIRP